MDSKAAVLTVEFKTNLLAPASGWAGEAGCSAVTVCRRAFHGAEGGKDRFLGVDET